MRIGVLGPLEVQVDGRPVQVSGARLRGLLIRLACDAPRAVSSSALMEAMWGSDRPADEANALQSLVSRLRRALGDAGSVGQTAGGYRLAVAAGDVDLHEFESLAAKGRELLRAGDAAGGERCLVNALALWRGEPETWGETVDATAYLGELEQKRLEATADLLDARLSLRRGADTVADLEALVARHPSRERLTGLLMRALAQSGRQADALSHYEELRRRLADDLGVDPSPQLQAIHLSILRGEIDAHPPGPERGRHSNLKAALTSFVGRDDELARIAKLLHEHRLITLVGPGGAGKTRLASVAADAVLDRMPDGVWLAELAPVTAAGDVSMAVLDALGSRDAALLDAGALERAGAAGARDVTTRLVKSLAGRTALLVLDNCEHVIEGAARLADDLLGRCPELRILATSREPLGITGEALVVVPPLAQPAPDADAATALRHPAVRLLADRASAVDPAFEVDDANVGAVVEIVRRLDGLPLAIELAAARLRTLPVTEVAARLSDRFRLLTGGSRTAMPRHRTLRGVVEWSWDLLDDAERLLAARLAVFAGSFAAPDAAAVCSDDFLRRDDVDHLLLSLVEKSLLQTENVDGGQRYRMLETLREYGLERLAERGEVGQLRRRHAARYAALAREASPGARGRDQLMWMARLEAERDNTMAALRFLCDDGQAGAAVGLACDLATYWTVTGRHSEAATALALALATPGPVDKCARLTAEALQAVNSLASDGTREPAEVESNLARVRELSHELDAPDVAADIPPGSMLGLFRPVLAMFADDDPERVDRLVAEGLNSADPWIAATVRMFHAAVAENNGDLATMRRDAELAFSQFREIGDRWGMASSLGVLSLRKTMDADLEGAIADVEQALALTEELAGHDDNVVLQSRLADLRLRVGDVDGARACADAMRQARSTVGFDSLLADLVSAEIARHDGDDALARQICEDMLARLEQLPAAHPAQAHVSAVVTAVAARLDIDDGDLDSATAQAARAYGFAIGTRDMPIIASVGVCVASLAAALDRPADAAEMLGAAARVRGAEDPTQPHIAPLTARLRETLGDDGFAAAYDAGWALERQAACERLDPATLDRQPRSPEPAP